MYEQDSNIIKIKIYGTEYPIKGDTDVAYMQKVAQFVDQKMYEVESSTAATSTTKIAILTALNIADELFREKLDKDQLMEALNQKIDKLSEMIAEETPEAIAPGKSAESP